MADSRERDNAMPAHDVMPPTPGRIVMACGPGFAVPAQVVRVHDDIGALVVEVVVFNGGYTPLGYLEDIKPDNLSVGVLPHKTMRDRPFSNRPPGPCYWVWPTETP